MAHVLPGHTVEYDPLIKSHAINFRALCGANLVTYPAEFRGVETRVLHRVREGLITTNSTCVRGNKALAGIKLASGTSRAPRGSRPAGGGFAITTPSNVLAKLTLRLRCWPS